jgi:Cu/Ag efflux pump CusA
MEKFFVSRPIFAISLAIVIVLVGLISIMGLPIEQYPDITPPVVEVSATYDGADAETVNNAVATPGSTVRCSSTPTTTRSVTRIISSRRPLITCGR